MAKVKYAIWSADMAHLALFSKSMITILNKKLEILCQVNERWESMSFDAKFYNNSLLEMKSRCISAFSEDLCLLNLNLVKESLNDCGKLWKIKHRPILILRWKNTNAN